MPSVALSPAGNGRTALLLGATGLVGGSLLDLLLVHPGYARLSVLARRTTGRSHPKLTEHLIDFEHLEGAQPQFAVDDVFCTLGTTIRKAGSRAQFRKVDLEYPLAAGGLAVRAGARQMLVVTALGANSRSRIFYNRVKGELEDSLKTVGLSSLSIFQPSILTGERGERRIGEEIGIRVMSAASFLMIGPLRKARPVPASTVARAMIAVALQTITGVRVFRSDEIAELGSAKEGVVPC